MVVAADVDDPFEFRDARIAVHAAPTYVPDRPAFRSFLNCRGHGDACENAELWRQAPHFDGIGGDVCRAAEKGGMAERQQPDIADQQIEGAGEQRHAQRLHQEDGIEEERRNYRERDQPGGPQPHRCRAGFAALG